MPTIDLAVGFRTRPEGRSRKRLGSLASRARKDRAHLDESFESLSVGFGQKLANAKAGLRHEAKRPRIHPVFAGLAVALVVFMVAAVSQYVIYRRAADLLEDVVQGNLKRLARVAASYVDPKLHQTFHSRDQETTDAYRRALEPLRRFQNSDSEISFVYTAVLKGNRATFILDPTEEGDEDGDGIDEKSHIGDAYPEATREMVNALRTGIATADTKPYTDRWGTFISGYAPVTDEKGNAIAIVGVDLSSNRYLRRLAGIHTAYQQGLLISVLLALLSGLAAGAMQKRVSDDHRKFQASDRAYREQIVITLERVEAAIRIAEVSRNRFSDLFEGIPVSCLTFDRDGRVFEWNGKALETFGPDPSKLAHRNLGDVIGREIFGEIEENQVRGVLEGQSFSDAVWNDGDRYFLLSGHPLCGPDGEVTGGILAAVDITRQVEAEDRVQAQLFELNEAHNNLNRAHQQLQSANARLEELATTDALTGLPNRRAFYEALQKAVARAKRGTELTLVQADIDHFKLFNDRFGHHAGDEVLKIFAETIRTSLRSADFLARHGGEEFYFILQDTSRSRALEIVERIREQVQNIDTGYGPLTASFGIAHWIPAIQTDEQLLRLTDEALYKSKGEGRNRITVAPPTRRAA